MLLHNHEIESLLLVKQSIERSISKPITIRNILRGTGFSETRFTQGFKFLFQYTVRQYHMTIAMEYAHSLLIDGRPAKEVSLLLGYRSQSHFNRTFRQIFAVPPTHISRNSGAV